VVRDARMHGHHELAQWALAHGAAQL